MLFDTTANSVKLEKIQNTNYQQSFVGKCLIKLNSFFLCANVSHADLQLSSQHKSIKESPSKLTFVKCSICISTNA